MSFNSIEYILLLCVVTVVYWLIKDYRKQNIFLLLVSYFFYASWDWRFLWLIIFSTLVAYLAGYLMPAARQRGYHHLLFALGMLANLVLLIYFKYFGFFVSSFADLLGVFGFQANISSLEIILPAGISFFTFQAMSYIFDVYRASVEPCKNLIDFALFKSFFPQLVAGPIERAPHILPQIQNPRQTNPESFESGLILILIGLFKKVVIADLAATTINAQAYTNPLAIDSGFVLQAAYLFAIQIYADFSAYSDIARGSARLLGFELMENFNQPYFAKNMTEFWRRWHISLSTWLRDYVYIPTSNFLKRFISHELGLYMLSVMITMLFSGLWHGANYTYILWGLMLGSFQIIQRLFSSREASGKQKQTEAKLMTALQIFLNFHLVLLAWVLFRSPTIRYVPDIYRQMLNALTSEHILSGIQLITPVLLLYALSFLIDMAQIYQKNHAFTLNFSRSLRLFFYTLALVLMIYATVKPYVPFIYFQF